MHTTPHGREGTRSFAELFGRSPDIVAEAPGRVNLIGEHTDYNGGFVLPVAIPQRARAEIALRSDRLVRMYSLNVEQAEIVEYTLGSEARTGTYIDYVQGVTQALAPGCPSLRGFELRLSSDVPLGSGLSSSAALTVSLLRALCQAFECEFDALEIALLAQRAENGLVGAPVGIMDPLAVSLAEERTALFIDTRSLIYKAVPLPEGAELIVIDSGVSHRNAGSTYRVRRAECVRAAGTLGVRELRDMGMPELRRARDLPDPLGRRVRHVITENARVMSAVTALKQGDLERLGELFDASQRSMRDDFEISTPEIETLVELLRGEPDVFGARLSGGGFGGAVVAVARAGSAAAIGQRVTEAYESKTGQTARVLVPEAPRPASMLRNPSLPPPEIIDEGW